MNQAYQHINPGANYYQYISDQIKDLVNRWNGAHSKNMVDPKLVIGEFKRVINYKRNIEVGDIKPAFDLGMMGQYGENFVLDSQTINRWFSGWLKQKITERLKDAQAYKGSNEPKLSEEQKQAKRQGVRNELIEEFMKYYNFYLEHGEVDGNIKKYYVVFWSWFRKLGLVNISEEEEIRMNEAEAKHLRDLLSKLRSPELSDAVYKIFIEIFKSLEGLDIETQLKSIKI